MRHSHKLSFVFFPILLCLTSLPRHVTLRRSRDPLDFHLNEAEILLGTKMLPEGVEIMSYLYKNVTARFYFMVEDEEATEIKLVVTPCESSITWSLYSLYLPLGDNTVDTPADANDDKMEVSRRLSTTQTMSRPPEILMTYSGREMTSYRNSSKPRIGTVYCVAITALEMDSQVRMSVSTLSLGLDPIYPVLPNNSQIVARYVGKRSIQLRWKPILTTSHFVGRTRLGHAPIEYCVAVNRKRHLPTRCAAYTRAFGQVLPTAPSGSGIRFAWQSAFKGNDNNPNNKNKKQLRNLRTRQTNKLVDDNVHYTCVGSMTSYTFKGAQTGGHTYYFNVYAINRKTNASVSYSGTRVITRMDRTISISDDELTHGYLRSSVDQKQYRYTFNKLNFHAKQDMMNDGPTRQGSGETRRLLISVQPCGVPLNLSVRFEGEEFIRYVNNNDGNRGNVMSNNSNHGNSQHDYVTRGNYLSTGTYDSDRGVDNHITSNSDNERIKEDGQKSLHEQINDDGQEGFHEERMIKQYKVYDTSSNISYNKHAKLKSSPNKNSTSNGIENKTNNESQKSDAIGDVLADENIILSKMTITDNLNSATHLRTYIVVNPRDGNYTISISRMNSLGEEAREERQKSISFHVFVTTYRGSKTPSELAHITPFPRLPSDVHLKSFDTLNTCRSITLAWMVTPLRQLYCLYAREVFDGGSLIKRQSTSRIRSDELKQHGKIETNSCMLNTSRPKSEKIACRFYKAADERRSVVTEMVPGLKPRSSYTFDVYVSKRSGGLSLPYDSLTVKTRSC